jgi:hypothetical protein
MSETATTALALSRLVLRGLVVLNLVIAVSFLGLLAWSFVFEGPLARHIAATRPGANMAIVLPTLRVWVLLGVAGLGAVHVILMRTLGVLKAVRLGLPFAPENATRLRTIAWCLLAVQVLDLGHGVMAGIVSAADMPMDWSFSAAGWLGVLLLFLLAGVFEEGARIRADLEAMI